MVITCEEWRDIEGYEGLYQVSNLGNVRSITRSVTYPNGGNRVFQGQELSKICAATGYYQVGLSRNGKVKVTNIHRLVAVAFIPNPENKPHVNHIDANKKNNDCSNLEWVTRHENMQHAHSLGLCNEDLSAAREARKRKVRRSDGAVFNSIREAANALGAHSGNISLAASGKRRNAAGYEWEYVKEV